MQAHHDRRVVSRSRRIVSGSRQENSHRSGRVVGPGTFARGSGFRKVLACLLNISPRPADNVGFLSHQEICRPNSVIHRCPRSAVWGESRVFCFESLDTSAQESDSVGLKAPVEGVRAIRSGRPSLSGSLDLRRCRHGCLRPTGWPRMWPYVQSEQPDRIACADSKPQRVVADMPYCYPEFSRNADRCFAVLCSWRHVLCPMDPSNKRSCR